MKTKFYSLAALFLLVFIGNDVKAQSPTFEWVKQIGGTDYDRGWWITVDNAGNIYTTGSLKGTADFDPGLGVFNLTAASDSDIYVSKLDSLGNFIWAKRLGGTGEEFNYNIDLDATGNVYGAGWFQGTSDFDPGPGTLNLTSMGSWDAFIYKLDSSGNLIWVKQIGGASPQKAYGISADGSGNTFTVGTFYGTVDFDPGPGVFNLTSSANDDIFICKLDPSGNFLWAKAFIGSFKVPYAITSDNDDNVYTTGIFTGTVDFDPGVGVYNLTSNGGKDVFISKLDSLGNFVWAKQLGGTSEDFGYCISVDQNQNVYTSGLFGGSVDFDPGPGTFNLTALGGNDAFISKLDQSGNFIWAKRLGNQSVEGSPQIAIDYLSSVYISSTFFGTLDCDPGSGIFNLFGPVNQTIFISKLDSGGNFNWAKQIGGLIDNYNWVASITLDPFGNIYSTGIFQNTEDFNPDSAIFNLTSLGSWDTYILKMSQITTGIQESEVKTNSLVYPNPTTNLLHLTLTKPLPPNTTITITDMQGRVVKEVSKITHGGEAIDVSALTQGVYLLKVNGQVQRFVKM